MRGRREVDRVCSMEGCGKPFRARKLCAKHYMRWRSHGDPNHTEHDYVTDPEESFKLRAVPAESGCLEWAGSLSKQGYGRITVDGKLVAAHRYAYSRVHGEIPQGMQVDHRCHNRKCCYLAHLRLVTPKQNRENASGLRSDNSSGHSNVRWNKLKNKWYVRLYSKGKNYSSGYYHPYELHVAAYYALQLRNKHFTHNDKDRE